MEADEVTFSRVLYTRGIRIGLEAEGWMSDLISLFQPLNSSVSHKHESLSISKVPT